MLRLGGKLWLRNLTRTSSLSFIAWIRALRYSSMFQWADKISAYLRYQSFSHVMQSLLINDDDAPLSWLHSERISSLHSQLRIFVIGRSLKPGGNSGILSLPTTLSILALYRSRVIRSLSFSLSNRCSWYHTFNSSGLSLLLKVSSIAWDFWD